MLALDHRLVGRFGRQQKPCALLRHVMSAGLCCVRGQDRPGRHTLFASPVESLIQEILSDCLHLLYVHKRPSSRLIFIKSYSNMDIFVIDLHAYTTALTHKEPDVPKGPLTPDGVRRRLCSIFIDLRRSRETRPTAGEVLAAFIEGAKKPESTWSKVPIPSERQVQSILQRFRNGLGQNPGLDQPWTLAISGEYGISSELNQTLLRVWAMCLLTRQPFTVRQARWVDRLRWRYYPHRSPDREFEVFDGGVGQTYEETWEYAARELIAEATGEPLDTSDLDARMIMDHRHVGLAIQAGLILTPPAPGDPPPIGEVDPITWQSIERPWGIDEILMPLNNPLEAEGFYYAWQRTFETGTRWRQLSYEERAEICEAVAERLVASGGEPIRTPTDLLKIAGVTKWGDYTQLWEFEEQWTDEDEQEADE
jgi:hypothetical protein